ncbi:MAG: hypothetical protein ACRDRP_04600 [Pseudonocardiaceae bacterium]
MLPGKDEAPRAGEDYLFWGLGDYGGELLAGRARGDYQAFCGAWLLAASLTDPGRGQYQRCPQRVMS